MPDAKPRVSELDLRLAEIDRRLREIQADLIPGRPSAPLAEPPQVTEPPPPEPPPREPPPPAPESPPPPPRRRAPHPSLAPPPAEPEPEPEPPAAQAEPDEPPRGRSGPLASLLQRNRRSAPAPAERDDELAALGEMHERLLVAMRELIDAYGAVVRHEQAPSAADEVSLSAGPFTTTRAVHRFVQDVSTLPGVRDVTLRGYDGPDRALLDVQLSEPTP
jgi:outer membrane biosynthesis protein TonB